MRARLTKKTIVLGSALAIGVAMVAMSASGHGGKTHGIMKGIAKQVKELGGMARGKTTFDQDGAEKAKAKLTALSESIHSGWEEPITAKGSRSSPKIWENWADFTAEADKLTMAAKALDTSSVASIQAGMRSIGESCKSCHSKYRLRK